MGRTQKWRYQSTSLWRASRSQPTVPTHGRERRFNLGGSVLGVSVLSAASSVESWPCRQGPRGPVPPGLSMTGGYEPGVTEGALERGHPGRLLDDGVKDHWGGCARSGSWEDGPPSGAGAGGKV